MQLHAGLCCHFSGYTVPEVDYNEQLSLLQFVLIQNS